MRRIEMGTRKKRIRNRNVFTLIELLIVIAMIAFMAGILLPALSKARDRAKQVKCAAQLKEINLCFQMYASDNNEFFPTLHIKDGTTYGIRWPHLVLSDKKNLASCPSHQYRMLWDQGKTSYGVNAFMIPTNGTRKVSGIKRASEKLLLADIANLNYIGTDCTGTWYSNGTTSFTEGIFYPRHDNGLNIGWVDGHVSYFKCMNRSYLAFYEYTNYPNKNSWMWMQD